MLASCCPGEKPPIPTNVEYTVFKGETASLEYWSGAHTTKLYRMPLGRGMEDMLHVSIGQADSFSLLLNPEHSVAK